MWRTCRTCGAEVMHQLDLFSNINGTVLQGARCTYAYEVVHRELEGLDIHVRRQQAPFS